MSKLKSMAAAILVASAPAHAQLTVERLYASPGLSGPTPRLPQLSPDGKWVSSLRNRPDEKERYDLWAVDTVTGGARMLVDSKAVGTGAALSEAAKMQRERARIADQKGIVSYSWAADGKSVLVPLDGDLYLAPIGGSVRRLTNTASDELDGIVSEKGGFVSFVRDQNLVVLDLATGKERALTQDGGGTTSWGLAEFIAQEELHRYRGHWWSPNDRYIAATRVDENGVAIVKRASIGANDTRVYEQRYPKAGTANAVVDLYVFDVASGAKVKVDLGPDADVYLARVDWARDGSRLFVQRLNRNQKRLELLEVDPGTGESRIILTDTSSTWINLNDDFYSLKDGSFLWSSERSGFRHLYRSQAGKLTQLTSGPWAVNHLVGVDEVRKIAYLTANRDTAVEMQVYAVSIDRAGNARRLTEAGFSNAAVVDKTGTRIIVSRSSTTQPPQSYLADANGKRLFWLEENRIAGDHPYAPYLTTHRPTTFGTLKAEDGQALQYRIIRPVGFAGPRPVLFQVYGGPQGAEVINRWGRQPEEQYWLQKGWIIFQLDNRGTGYRGTAFDAPIYRALGGAEVVDQLAGLAWLKQQPGVDPARVVVTGWSYGGYMVLKLLEAAPGQFAAGIAGAPVTRWELYDTAYTERYLGNPSLDPTPYDAASALKQASKIRDPLLLVHGMSDDNVVFDNSTALMAELQAAAVPFEVMVYPGFGHGLGRSSVSTHFLKTVEAFLIRRTSKP